MPELPNLAKESALPTALQAELLFLQGQAVKCASAVAPFRKATTRGAKTYGDTIFALFQKVKEVVKYNGSIDATRSPKIVLEAGSGDSKKVALLLASLLLDAGFQVRFKVVSTKPGQPFHHIYVQVYTGGWLSLDPLFTERVGQEPNGVVAEAVGNEFPKRGES